jgi:GMP synthase-like glutamine amidotransferase
MAKDLGGVVRAAGKREYGKTELTVLKEGALFDGLEQEIKAPFHHRVGIIQFSQSARLDSLLVLTGHVESVTLKVTE